MSTLNTNDQADLLFGDAAPIAAYLGVTVKTVKRWQAGQPMPAAPLKLMQLRYGDLSGLFGSDWSGFRVGVDGLLYHPYHKYGFSAPEVLGWFFGRQELAHLRREVKRLESELGILRTDAWAADKVRGLVSGTLRAGVPLGSSRRSAPGP